jgi:hypothetical protein
MLEMFEKLGRRDRIALGIGVGATALFLLLNFGVLPLLEGLGASPEAVQQKESELRREKQLLAAEALEKTRLSAARERLTGLEASLLESSTPSLANAEWQRLVRQLAESKDIELGSSELLRTQDLGAGYSLVTGRALFRCRLDQLVDLLAAIAASPKLLSVSGLSVFASQSDSQGRMSVQLTIGAATRTAKPATEQPAAH